MVFYFFSFPPFFGIEVIFVNGFSPLVACGFAAGQLGPSPPSPLPCRTAPWVEQVCRPR